MEFAIGLFIAWALITLLGHTSWLIVRAIIQVIAGLEKASSPPGRLLPSKPGREVDAYAVTRRTIRKLRAENRITASFEADLMMRLRESQLGVSHDASTQVLAPPRPESIQDQPSRLSEPGAPDSTSPSASPPPVAATSTVKSSLTPTRPDTSGVAKQPADRKKPVHQGEPIVAALVEPRSTQRKMPSVSPVASGSQQSGDRAEQPPPTSVAGPTLSKSEIIQSFLSSHNIRWGELAAGMLIVGCSIGLVISRWSSLVQTHRVIPSLIFLGANVAIYAAGLYTLSRWRLRHTSRAVLVIATLLVPLSVLAGLAAAGTRADAVRLNDPITLTAILLAGFVYAVFLYLGGKALGRKSHALPMLAAVAGPVMTLPLMPAAVRNFGSNAGWLLAIGSASVVIAAVLMQRLRHKERASIGPSGGRVRLSVMAFGGFSLAVAIAFAAFSVRGYGWTAMLPLAITAIPAVMALSGMSRGLMQHARSDSVSMAGGVILCCLLGLAFVAFPPSLISPSWVWMWALSLGLSGAAVGWVFYQPRWLAAATLPIGLAAVVTSKVWIAGQDWSASPMWMRLISGEAMLASLLLTVGSGLCFWVVREPVRRRWMEYAAIGWGGLTLSLAAFLSVAPVGFLGVVPSGVATSVLLASVVASFVYSLRDRRAAYAASAATLFAWLSIARPDEWFAIEAVREWMFVATAVSATLLLMSELSRWWATRRERKAIGIASLADDVWLPLANGFAMVAGVAAIVGVNSFWMASALTLFAVALIVLWASTICGSIAMLRGSQIATALLTGVIGYAKFNPGLFGSEAWSRGTAVWGWTIAVGLTALFWLAIREVVRLLAKPTPDSEEQVEAAATTANGLAPRDRMRHILGDEAAPAAMPDGWMAIFATGLACLASAYFFGTLSTRVSPTDLSLYEASWGLPVVGLLCVGGAGWLIGRHDKQVKLSLPLTAAVVISTIVWVSCQLSDFLLQDASNTLIAATTAASLALVAAMSWMDKHDLDGSHELFPNAAIVVTVLAVGVASSALLFAGLFEPIFEQQLARPKETIAVSSWWLAAALGLIWKAKQTKQPFCGAVSASLFAAAAALVVPAFTQVSPAVWLQVGALALIGWLMIARWWGDRESQQALRPAIDGSFLTVLLAGAVTSLLVTASLVLDLNGLDRVFGPAGCVLSVAAVIGLCSERVRAALQIKTPSYTYISWPVGISLLAGQFGWLADSLGWVSGVQVVETVIGVWVATAIAALWTYYRRTNWLDFAHIAGVGGATAALALALGSQSSLLPWMSMASLIAAGILVARVAVEREPGRLKETLARILGWLLGAAGLLVLVFRIADRSDPSQTWTMVPIWLGAWVIAWRWSTRDSSPESNQSSHPTLAIPDLEFAAAVLIAAIAETAFYVMNGSDGRSSGWLSDPFLWARVATYVLVSGSAVWHVARGAVWTISIGTLVATTSMVTVQGAILMDATMTQRLAWGALSSGFIVAFVGFWLPGLSRALGRLSRISPNRYFTQLVHATWINSAVVALFGAYAAIQMMFLGAPAADIRLTIATVALAAWAIAEMAEESNLAKLRSAAVAVGLGAVGLWASVDAGATEHPLLAASMRWLVASVFTIPMLFFVIPKLIGTRAAERWRDALRMGTKVVAAAAVGSLVSMFVMELVLRNRDGIEGLPLPIVIGAAVTLVLLSALSGVIALASGPQSTWRERLNLNDGQRRTLIVAAQAIGLLAWIHLFLCQPDWAFAGLREYWPYTVMVLAFVSVGVTEWARRRGDKVMSSTLSQTALYLPLIPVLGFWMSGSISELTWTFGGGRVRYDMLLLIGTIYYIGIASLWKGVMPRVTAIVLGNAAWWVMLTQWPGWEFLAHPQLWLIPPAVCVLVVAHLYRDRLEPGVSSAIRYAATLLIYVSSTADMLIQQIGSSLWGPIILILLALLGMLAGVVLRVRPFLYLGAAFVFLGVTSMVWHAHQRTGLVWPWWVFGISTGLCLLVGLTVLEKYKPQLRDYANRLATWEG